MGYLTLEIDLVLENIVDPDEMPNYAAFHLGLEHLTEYHFWVSWSKRAMLLDKI